MKKYMKVVVFTALALTLAVVFSIAGCSSGEGAATETTKNY